MEGQQQTQPTYDTESEELNPGHIGGRRVLSPLCHPCTPKKDKNLLDFQLSAAYVCQSINLSYLAKAETFTIL